MVVSTTCILCSLDSLIASRQWEVINPLYLAVVRSHLKGCIQSDPLMDILKQVQQRAIKMIWGLHPMTYEEHERLELVGFKERRLKGGFIGF